ncbi:hypothetical protein [Mucilaginibacter panaciglaebae]|uniref:Uncharacterized protein n=1 Tax=Mucilaginibacter panaciglaebae TaxID=502331 RepID=A0ABP7WZQ8_9SPHI
MNLIEIKKNRFLYLQKIYEESGGGTNAAFDMTEVGNELGFDYMLTRNIVDYLINEGLIEPYALGGSIKITHWGIKEVEEAIENPSESTEHFAPINTYNINIHSSGEGNIINTGNENIISITTSSNTKQITEKVNEIITVLKTNPNIPIDSRDNAIEVFQELLNEMTNGIKPSPSVIDKMFSYGGSIGSIGSLVVGLIQLFSKQ